MPRVAMPPRKSGGHTPLMVYKEATKCGKEVSNFVKYAWNHNGTGLPRTSSCAQAGVFKRAGENWQTMSSEEKEAHWNQTFARSLSTISKHRQKRQDMLRKITAKKKKEGKSSVNKNAIFRHSNSEFTEILQTHEPDSPVTELHIGPKSEGLKDVVSFIENNVHRILGLDCYFKGLKVKVKENEIQDVFLGLSEIKEASEKVLFDLIVDKKPKDIDPVFQNLDVSKKRARTGQALQDIDDPSAASDSDETAASSKRFANLRAWHKERKLKRVKKT